MREKINPVKNSDLKPKIYVIVGPTASGKTGFSIKLAKKVGGETISADSRQVYKGLNIGSGKVTKKEMTGIPHHLLDVVSPKKIFTVSDFKKLADQKITEIIARGKTPIIVGGTGFYIQAVVDDLILPEVEPDKKLREQLSKKTPAELFTMLKKLDPARAKTIDGQNPVRLIRAIEIAKKLGKVPALRSRTSDSLEVRLHNAGYDFEIIGVKTEQEELNKKIYKRLIERVKSGMVAEVKKIHQSGVSWKRLEQLGLEYRYIALFLQKKLAKKEMIEKLYSEIVKYSKRQITWFKKDKRIKWQELTPNRQYPRLDK
ncbi:MAG: tRNA (adenosine(37)-N6)-dimethylallyltransferase MiaA [Candidatus Paceibacterota bacterium]|jgi:tRNA dimethylallyltransferase